MDSSANYIGGDFELNPMTLNNGPGDDFEKYFGLRNNHLYFATGRKALSYILGNIKNKKRILVPDYACWDSLGPVFLKHGYEWQRYFIGPDFSPDFSKLKGDIDVILFINFFGVCNFKSFASQIRKRFPKIVMILDNVQALYDLKNNGENGSWADWQFFSFRKFLPLPGGAMALNINKQFDTSKVVETKYDEDWQNAAIMRYKFLHSSNVNDYEKKYLPLFKKAKNNLICNSIDISKLSYLLQNYYDLTKFASKRRNNYRYLAEGLNKFRWINACIPELNPEQVPHFLPVMIEHNLRNRLKLYLAENNIFCPIHWPKWTQENFSESLCISKNLLSLPIDQRYMENDMKHLLKILKSFKT